MLDHMVAWVFMSSFRIHSLVDTFHAPLVWCVGFMTYGERLASSGEQRRAGASHLAVCGESLF